MDVRRPRAPPAVAANILWDTIRSVLKGEKIRVPSREYRGSTYVNELIDQFGKVFDLPFGTYHVGSKNELNRYEVVSLILRELGLENRIPDLIERDDVKYADTPRDARLDTSKIESPGFRFSDTPDTIRRCIEDYSLRSA